MSPRTEKQLEQIRQRTRSHIFDTALALFASRGYHGTSMEMIAREANVSKGLAYHYFKKKKDILAAIIEDGLTQIESVVLEATSVADPYRQIALLIDRTFSRLQANESFWRLYTSLMLQTGVLEEYRAVISRLLQSYVAHFESLFAEMGREDPAFDARLFASSFDGIMLHYLLDPQHYPLQQMKNGLIRRYGSRQ